MKSVSHLTETAEALDQIVSLCYGSPRGDELPQVGSVDDMVVDIYCDILNVPRESASAIYHHQVEGGFDYEGMIH